ncbi:hemolysin family protein [Sphingomonas sp. S1-29]|uniref:hemolysin family protein n=1 Tax=Sphingomonas sp. S1-29 TaxID=2991074 RepID=UPI00223F1442|nr:hemolysin family protein [Sphingomonas sp. S1-29]UZK70592.1 hemolysin family protein [Sphingomonas sp. S1-29]
MTVASINIESSTIQSYLIPVAIILVMVAANALYVAAEFATVGARKSRVQEEAESGNRTAAKLLKILRDPVALDNYVAGCQVGITISSLVAGAYAQAQLTPLLTPHLGAIGGPLAAIIIVLLLITVLQVVLGELLPKTIALRYPERLSMATMLPMRISLVLFRPLIFVFNGTAFAIMRLFKLNVDHGHTHVHSPDELEALFKASAAGGLIDADERDMLSGALSVDHRIVREIMTPRTRMITVRADESVEVALRRSAETPYSRFPVTGETTEDVVGIVHLRTLFAAFEADPRATVASIQRDPLIVADVMTVPKLWQTLQAQGRRSAMVINEYGSFTGLVTLEDALEEVFGEVQDEFDDEEELVIEQDGHLSVRGDVRLSMLADRHDIMLPQDRADTVSGLVWHELGRMPAKGDRVRAPDTPYTLVVEAMQGHAVRRVRIERLREREEV